MCEDYILIYVLQCTATVESLQRHRFVHPETATCHHVEPRHIAPANYSSHGSDLGSLAVLDRGEISVRNTPSLNIVRFHHEVLFIFECL